MGATHVVPTMGGPFYVAGPFYVRLMSHVSGSRLAMRVDLRLNRLGPVSEYGWPLLHLGPVSEYG